MRTVQPQSAAQKLFSLQIQTDFFLYLISLSVLRYSITTWSIWIADVWCIPGVILLRGFCISQRFPLTAEGARIKCHWPCAVWRRREDHQENGSVYRAKEANILVNGVSRDNWESRNYLQWLPHWDSPFNLILKGLVSPAHISIAKYL